MSSTSANGKRRSPAGKSGKRGGRGRPQDVKGWALWVLKWGFLSAVALFLLLVVVLFIAYSRTKIPNPNKAFQTQTTFVYYSDGKTQLAKFADQNRISIPYSQMPTCMKQSVVAAENKTFWTDKGIDPKGILRALFNNAQGNSTQGASTITQQYVKILYLNQQRTYTRKIKEAFLALKLQRTETKQEILEGYLNTIYFGRGAYGIEAAAQAYFNRPAHNLSVPQCAVLASELNNPTLYNPTGGPDNLAALQSKYRSVLGAMASMHYITDQEAADDGAALPAFPKQKVDSANGGQTGFVKSMALAELQKLGFSESQIQGGGLRITTTFQKGAMQNAEEAALKDRPSTSLNGSKITDKELHVAVASVAPGTGALVGFYAGQDFLKDQTNWAATTNVSVGSTFKPFTLATAIKAGFSLKSTFDGNSPYTFPDGTTVHNEGEQAGEANGHSYGAQINAIYALQQSVNTAFIDMSQSIPDGPNKILKTAEAMGVPPAKASQNDPGIPNVSSADLNANARITLGGAGISPINMANAFATIAAGGQRSNVHVIDKVLDRDGTVLYQFKDRPKQVVDQDIDRDVSYAMQQVVNGGTGKRALVLGRPAAGKTGTATCGPTDTQFVCSAWFVGFTPQLSTAVMYARGPYGRSQLDGWMPSYFGADYPTETWTDVMHADLSGQPVESFPPPAYVTGTAPASGHQPTYAPPPPPPPAKHTKQPKPKHTITLGPPLTSAPPPAPTDTTAPSSQPSPTDTGAPPTSSAAPTQ